MAARCAADSTALAQAYRAAHYVLMGPAVTVTLAVGEVADAAEALVDARDYAFLTAYNPASQPRGDAENRAANDRLLERLRQTGALLWPMRATSADAGWDEPGWLVGDLPLARLDAIAREFGQAGTLAWRRGMPVRLRMYLPRPAGPAIDHVDWVECGDG